MMIEALTKDVRARFEIGVLRPPADLWGIQVLPAAIQCVCPRRTLMDYKSPSDAKPFINHALHREQTRIKQRMYE